MGPVAVQLECCRGGRDGVEAGRPPRSSLTFGRSSKSWRSRITRKAPTPMLLSKHPRVIVLSSPPLVSPHAMYPSPDTAHELSKGHTIQPTSYQPTSIKGPFYPEHACGSMWICAIPHRSGSIDPVRQGVTRTTYDLSIARSIRAVRISTQLGKLGTRCCKVHQSRLACSDSTRIPN